MSWTPYAKEALLNMLFKNVRPGWEGPSWAWTATMKVSLLGTAAVDTDDAAGVDGKLLSYTGVSTSTPARSSAGWTIANTGTSNVSIYPTAALTFGKKTDVGTANAAGIAIELVQGGTDYPWIYGTNALAIDQNETPTITANTTGLEIKEV